MASLYNLLQTKRKPGSTAFALSFVLLSAVLLYCLPTQVTWVNGMNLFTQPAFWPYVSTTIMLVFGVVHLIGTWSAPKLQGRWAEVLFWVKSCEFAAWFLIYVTLVPVIGYLIATLIFTTSLTFRLGYRRGRAFIAAAFLALAIVVVFKSLLQVKIPGGMIYQYLPTTLRSFMLTYF